MLWPPQPAGAKYEQGPTHLFLPQACKATPGARHGKGLHPLAFCHKPGKGSRGTHPGDRHPEGGQTPWGMWVGQVQGATAGCALALLCRAPFHSIAANSHLFLVKAEDLGQTQTTDTCTTHARATGDKQQQGWALSQPPALARSSHPLFPEGVLTVTCWCLWWCAWYESTAMQVLPQQQPTWTQCKARGAQQT